MITDGLARQPAVLLTGARQAGKSLLARKVAATRPSVIYDLERDADLTALSNPAVALRRHSNKLVVIDEVQEKPQLFSELRAIIDELRAAGKPVGKFLLLGSVTGRLQRQSEGLTGRITQVQLHPFDLLEVAALKSPDVLWERGGYPLSLLADTDRESGKWRLDYITAALQKDVLPAKSRVTAQNYLDLLEQLAARQKDILNKSNLASNMGLSGPTVEVMLARLEEMMLIRRLPAYAKGVAQRVARNPKYYIRDSGLFHAVLNRGVQSPHRHGRDVALRRGADWEGFVIQNLLAVLPDLWRPFFFRAHSTDSEIDLIIERPGGSLWAIEIKAGQSPHPDRRFLKPLQHLAPERCFVVHGGEFKHRGSGDIEILSLADMMNELLAHNAAARPPGPEVSKLVEPDASLAAVVQAIRERDAPVNLRRAEFLEGFCRRFESILADSPAPHDQGSRVLWEQLRGELVEWLALEGAAVPKAPEAEIWMERLVQTLERMLNALPAPAESDQREAEPIEQGAYDFSATFGRLCCYDLFVHVLAALMRARCFAFVHQLVERRYYVHGHMLESICFWSSQPADPAGSEEQHVLAPSQKAEDFMTERPSLPVESLIEAELVLALGSIVASESGPDRPGRMDRLHVWFPWIAQGRQGISALPFFIRAQARPGAQHLAACLGMPADQDSIKTIRQAAENFFERVLAADRGNGMRKEASNIDAADWQKIRRCLDCGKWHDLA